MNQDVLVDINDGVMIVTINRPEVRNAANRAVAEGVAAAMDELDGNPDLRVAILVGAGNTFCSGMDLKAYLHGDLPVIEGRGFAGVVEKPPRKPLIAAVEGYALAGGCELALVCDLIVSGAGAKFGIPEAKRGLAAGAGGLMALPRQIPPRLAMELALLGDPVSAQRAYEMGLINRVTEDGKALEVAMDLANRIAANGPLGVAASKQIIQESPDWSRDEMFCRQRDLLQPVFGSEDAKEGARAFTEKRAPVWKGC